ncbi:hypothetical protein [Streptomyces sp. NTH33]|nr:hypothetical protein [Streptomyces sp. NTH33]
MTSPMAGVSPFWLSWLTSSLTAPRAVRPTTSAPSVDTYLAF